MDGGGSMARVEDFLHKIMRNFDASDEHSKELRGYLANIRQKVEHEIPIKNLGLKIAQLSSLVNPRKPGTLPSNTVQNPKNDGHYMAVTTRGGKQTIDPPMASCVEDEIRRDDEVMKVSGELVDKSGKQAERPQRVNPIPIPPPPLPQKVGEKTEDGKYQSFITMLK